MDVFTWAGQALQTAMPFIAAVSLFVSAFVAFWALRRKDIGDHHRWLQEKRREAYVDFLSAARKASKTISASDWRTKEEREAAISHDEDEVEYALDVVSIVGPNDMALKGSGVVARLKMDRLFYSPTRDTQLLEGKDKYIERAEATGNSFFHQEFAALYAKEPFDVTAYEAIHAHYPLRVFWGNFVRAARDELAKDRPSFWATRFRD